MGKSNKPPKPDKSDRKTPRTNVGVPDDWHAVMRRLAAKRKQPVLYLLISLTQEEAKKEGIEDLPLAPWEEDTDEE